MCIRDSAYDTFHLPDMQDEFMVMPASVALQLLAYYVSSDKGFDAVSYTHLWNTYVAVAEIIICTVILGILWHNMNAKYGD